MKLLLMLVALVAATAAAPPAKSPKAAPVRTKTAASSQSLFRQFNLAPLWHLHAKKAEAQTMLGCMGPQYRRLDIVYKQVRRDGKNPTVYHVEGKSRERERIMPFRGTITLTSIRKVKPEVRASDFKALAHYKVTGRFRLTESPAEEGAGVFTGTLAMTFSHTAAGLAYMPARGEEFGFMTPGEGATFTSQWASAAHPQPVKIVWASNFMDIAHTVMDRFYIGDRGMHINPKYARVGWNRYWENEEWWAEAEEPVL
ncbi:hypothetical protein FY528_01825 [Hymenobacter lutimineralis]|uniref:Uncharacterized protein n=1 Tax=Hymenobacter lutimineralis TaxID=2606448 RepID=A0A5D6VGI7_9BACT|nr:hypothetical protein [Hymenobacter lutimineralis]TYZ14490.1 hypothetical protein FY528_01825 [Hymenobacter lutimineralis]